jgi:regulator of sigma E protease
MQQKTPDFITPRFPFVAGQFPLGSAAKAAGMQINDKIIGINDSIVLYFDQFRSCIGQYKNKTVTVKVIRGTDTLGLPVKVSDAGFIGVGNKALSGYFTLKEKQYNLFTAIPAGVEKTFVRAGDYIKSIKLLFSQDKAYESVGGFITIGSIFPATWDWQAFWALTAFLSIMLAIINVLPIPALDGGHVMFLLYEIIFRRKPSDKFMEYAQIVGMVILFGLLIFSNGQDVMKLFRH